MPFPYVFTFYSYKGGVGRSMAVMNVAYTLAGWGRHVLVLDMDLEAPGLSDFLQRSREFAEPEPANPKDILTLLGEAVRAVRAGGAIEDLAKQLPPVSHYIRSVAEEKLAKLRPQLGQLGRLDVLGTDLERDYLGRLAQLGLPDLAQSQLVDLSRLLHHYFKAQRFPHRPLGIEPFEPPLDTPYDYVLVDSRTGITEIGGLCVGPLADRLVILTSLNDQNVSGTLRFLDEAGIEPKPRPRDDAPWDEADTIGTDHASLGPKPTILVASPVPVGEIAYQRQRLGELEKSLGIRPISLPYHPQMALMETVFVRDCPEEHLANEYKRLADRVTAQVGDDFRHLLQEIDPLREKIDLSRATAAGLRLASQEPRLGTSFLAMLVDHGRRDFEAGCVPDPEIRQLWAVLSRDPRRSAQALANWGRSLSTHARNKSDPEAEQLLQLARQKCLQAEEIRPGIAAYNLACVEALSGNSGETIRWLQASEAAGDSASRAQISADKDFDRIRNHPDFVRYVESLPEN